MTPKQYSKPILLTIAFTTLITITGCSVKDTTTAPVQLHATNLGNVYTDNAGMTLYTFTKDKHNISNCNGGCAAKWPPLLANNATAGAGKFSIITRKDNSKQWALNGKPLYRWFKDKVAGDTTGDGVKSVWFAAKP